MKVIITGSLAFDYIMDFPGKFADHILPEKIHEINLSFLVKTLSKQRGGTAGNMAYNLALLGMNPTILATAGNDFSDYKKQLDKAGVDTSMIRIIKTEPTASAYIFTDQADNQITGFYPGAMNVAAKLSLTQKPFVVISPNNPDAMVKYVQECQQLGVDYMFDPGMQLPRLSNEDLKVGIEGAKIVIGNDYEMALIRFKLQLKSFSKKSQVWITTLGDKGSIIEVDGRKIIIPPAKPNEVLDPTGAGDAYRAGFLAGFLRGLAFQTCGRMGSVSSVYTVEKYGTQTHKFTKTEFCQRYKANFREELKW